MLIIVYSIVVCSVFKKEGQVLNHETVKLKNTTSISKQKNLQHLEVLNNVSLATIKPEESKLPQ